MNKQKKSNGGKEFGNYILGKTIGEGTFGKVKLATHKPTTSPVAIKILEKNKISEVADVQRVARQMHILKLIRHPNIVQLYQIIQTPKQLFLVMEYMPKGQLFDYIVKNKKIDEKQACRMFCEIIDGIEYIHKIGVVHRDLKPENILLDENKALKIVDFGLSNTYKKEQLLKTPCGSPCYAAPEMIKGDRYDGLKVDIWSSGVILFAMLCGYLPFEDHQTPTLFKKILSGDYSFHHQVSAEARHLIDGILNSNVQSRYKNDQSRYTIHQIRTHPWLLQTHRKQQGVIVGYNTIPVDEQVLSTMSGYNLDAQQVRKCLEANRHNSLTTCYYLAMKKSGKSTKVSSRTQLKDNSLGYPKSIYPQIYTDQCQGTKNSRKSKEMIPVRSKDKIKSKEKLKRISVDKENNKSIINTKIKIDTSLNHVRGPQSSKSLQKPIKGDNRILLKQKERLNISVVSKSKDRVRSRVNSFGKGYKKTINEVHNTTLGMVQEPVVRIMNGKRINKKQIAHNNSLKYDMTKMKARRL